jgi:TPR repeat protein
MKKTILYFLIFSVIFFPILVSSSEEKETYPEAESTVNELIEGKNWKENRRAAKEAFQKDLKVITPKAEAGDSEAQYQLGKHYDYGWGVERDALEAAKWYEKAAIQGHIEAQHSLGLLNTHAGNYIFANPEDSVKWFRTAAEHGHPSSQHFLADAYVEGSGVV